MLMLTEQQSLVVRYIQAIGIIFVVIGHYPIKPVDVLHPYLFHMPLFFFLGGVIYKKRKFLDSVNSIFKKHILYIVYTYIIIGLMAIILLSEINPLSTKNIFQSGFFETISFTLKNNFHNNSFFLVAWFLFSYSIVSLVCNVLIKTIKREVFIIPFALLLGYVAVDYISLFYKDSKEQYLNVITQVMYGGMFYLLGYSLRNLLYKLNSIYIPFIIICILFTEKNMSMLYGMIMSWSSYHKGFFNHTLNAFLCIILIFSIANIIATKKYKLLIAIGNSSKSIMSYHLISFILLDLIFYYFGYIQAGKISGLSHYSTKEFWYLYIIIGLSIPMILDYSYRKIKIKLINRHIIN